MKDCWRKINFLVWAVISGRQHLGFAWELVSTSQSTGAPSGLDMKASWVLSCSLWVHAWVSPFVSRRPSLLVVLHLHQLLQSFCLLFLLDLWDLEGRGLIIIVPKPSNTHSKRKLQVNIADEVFHPYELLQSFCLLFPKHWGEGTYRDIPFRMEWGLTLFALYQM